MYHSGPESPWDTKTPAGLYGCKWLLPVAAKAEKAARGCATRHILHIVYHSHGKKYTTFFVHNLSPVVEGQWQDLCFCIV